MSTTHLSDALRAQLRGTAAKQSDLSASQRSALRTWAQRQRRAKQQARPSVAPSGALIWM
jgi:hypothetical protein